MNTKLLPLLALFVLVACGDSEATSNQDALISWSAGDSDFFGCLYVAPEPWESDEAHQAVCGEDCQPVSVNRMFVACVSEEMGLAVAAGDAPICMTHPVTREEITFPNQVGVGFTEVCWAACEFQGVDLSLPDECFEDVN